MRSCPNGIACCDDSDAGYTTDKRLAAERIRRPLERHVFHARQMWMSLDVYEERGELDERTIEQCRECLEHACYEWDDFLEGVVCAWLANGGRRIV